MGYKEEDLIQIEEATSKTVYKMDDKKSHKESFRSIRKKNIFKRNL